ncbi:hypothetical protein HanLR1_Chr16g0642951 [Helianthus annuus]|nr:hypothetical protein HanLR1_Chr16g0642951 [Helianthus annuus]
MVGFFELANEIKTSKNEKSYKTISHESKFTRKLEYIILYTYMSSHQQHVYCVTLVGIQCPGLQITDACNDMTWFQHQYTGRHIFYTRFNTSLYKSFSNDLLNIWTILSTFR